jgi:Flp pilus assembly protein TadG
MTTPFHGARQAGGTALVEFALVAPLLLLMLAGVLDYGMALRTAISVAAAARAGAQYGSRSPGNAADTAGILAAAVNAAPDVKKLSVASSMSCQCSGGGAVSCSGSCTGGKMLTYVQVTAQASTSTIFNYSGLGFSGSTSTQASMRAQ